MIIQDLSQECKACSTFKNQSNSPNHKTKEENTYNNQNRCRTSMWQISTSIHNKKKTANWEWKETFLTWLRASTKSMQLTSCLMVKDLMFSPEINNKERLFTLIIPISHCCGDSSQYNNVRNGRHRHQKSWNKSALWSDDMIVCIENPKGDGTET